jgi:hypothetical protein
LAPLRVMPERFVVPLDELQLAAVKQATLGVDLVDRNLQPSGDRFPGMCRLPRKGSDMTNFYRVCGFHGENTQTEQ